MATIEITKAHSLSVDEAKRRAEQVLEKLKSKGIQGTWSGNTFTITKPATGTMVVSASDLRIAIDLPFMLRPLKGKIEQEINNELNTALA